MGQGQWALGADGALVNNPGNMTVNFAVANGGSFVLFASDLNAELVPLVRAGVQFVDGVRVERQEERKKGAA